MSVYILKKLFTIWFLPPGIFILLLFIIWLFQVSGKKRGRFVHFNLVIAALIYVMSIEPVSMFLLKTLEERKVADIKGGDVIIVLGGGFLSEAPDFNGKGIPKEDVMSRVVGAFRLYRKTGLPVIVSGGKGRDCKDAEAPVIKDFLVELGVDEKKIILESKSMDTRDNAVLTRKICDERGFKNPVLVTSAYHMKRAVLSFEKAGVKVIPFSVDYKADKICYDWTSFMPEISLLHKSCKTLKEYFGLLFYMVKD